MTDPTEYGKNATIEMHNQLVYYFNTYLDTLK